MNDSQVVAKDPQDEITYPEFNKLKQRCVRTVRGVIFSGFTDRRKLILCLLVLINSLPVLLVLAPSQVGLGIIPT